MLTPTDRVAEDVFIAAVVVAELKPGDVERQIFGADLVEGADNATFAFERTAPMTSWTSDELDRIEKAEELEIAALRADGTLRKPVTIWVVRHGDDFYIRSGYGNRAAWYRGIQRRREGHIKTGGVEKDVAFVDADPALNDQIDAAYRSKYRRHEARWFDPMVAAEARSTTIKLVPR
jgi:hypothetical protein